VDPGGQCGIMEIIEMEKSIRLALNQGGILCIR